LRNIVCTLHHSRFELGSPFGPIELTDFSLHGSQSDVESDAYRFVLPITSPTGLKLCAPSPPLISDVELILPQYCISGQPLAFCVLQKSTRDDGRFCCFKEVEALARSIVTHILVRPVLAFVTSTACFQLETTVKSTNDVPDNVYELSLGFKHKPYPDGALVFVTLPENLTDVRRIAISGVTLPPHDYDPGRPYPYATPLTGPAFLRVHIRERSSLGVAGMQSQAM
jgi:hypothetical protein